MALEGLLNAHNTREGHQYLTYAFQVEDEGIHQNVTLIQLDAVHKLDHVYINKQQSTAVYNIRKESSAAD